jgi:hypothetical protein
LIEISRAETRVETMSILTRIKRGLPHLHESPIEQRSPTTPTKALTGFVVERAERYGASYLFGYIKGRYRERAMWRGCGIDLWAGGLLTLTSAWLEIASSGRSLLAPHLIAVGDAGVQSFFNSIGAAHGGKASGRPVYAMNEGAPKVAIPAGMSQVPDTVLGAIGPMPQGAYLSAEELANASAPRVKGNE